LHLLWFIIEVEDDSHLKTQKLIYIRKAPT
jgi:hypothetical protein